MKSKQVVFAAWWAVLLISCEAEVVGPNRPPVAVVGMDVVALVGERVTLDGSDSFDPEWQPLFYRWELLTHPVDPNDPNASVCEFNHTDEVKAALTPYRPGVYLVGLTVSDGHATSAVDTLRVSASPAECKNDGTACSSGDWCTLGETCLAGVCQGGTPRDCSTVDDDCNLGVCDATQKLCTKEPRPNATACDDSFFCTGSDACQNGTCVGTVRTCAPADGCHEGVCNEATDQCDQRVLPNNTPCTDNPVCTMNAVCAAGTCTGVPLDADGDGHQPIACGGRDCDDARGNVNPGVFEGGNGSAVCTDGIDNDCDGKTDSADSPCRPCTGPQDCADGDACNGSEGCVASKCTAGPPTDCDDQNPCTDDRCDPVQGCLHPANSLPCDDGLFCTGNDTCTGGHCTGGPSPCTTACQTVCDEGSHQCQANPAGAACAQNGIYCDGAEACNGQGACISAGNPCLPESICRKCNETGKTCNVRAETPCEDDGRYCTGAEVCNGSGACVSKGNPCLPESECHHCNDAADNCRDPTGTACTDDGLRCNGEERCDGLGTCGHTDNPCLPESACWRCDEARPDCALPKDTTCTDDGTYCNGPERCDGAGQCVSTGNPCLPESECKHCNEEADTCRDKAGTACQADAFTCTLDQCDGAGTCEHTPDDDACAPQEECRPTCFPQDPGCGSPPGAISLNCPASADPLSTPPPTCKVDLGSSGLGGCLSCTATIAPLLVDLADFGDAGGACSLDGWSLVSGDLCLQDPAAGCVDSGTRAPCCADFATICKLRGGKYTLVSDRQTNCGSSNLEEWRIQKTFDTRGLSNLEFCLDVASLAAGTDEAISVLADSQDVAQAVVLCKASWIDGMRDTLCGALPSQFEDLAAVTLTVVAHSSGNDHVVAIDRAMLKGWPKACPRQIAAALTETFATCPTDPGSGWNVNESSPDVLFCNTLPSGRCYDTSPLVYVRNGDATLERTVSTLDLDADLRLCFSYGDNRAGVNESLTVQVDAGLGPVTVFAHAGDAAGYDICRRHCAHLSEAVPGIANNPSVTLRFALKSSAWSNVLFLDQIVLTGGKACPAGTALGLSSPIDAGSGAYTFEADPKGAQLATEITCQWGIEADHLQDSASINFVHR